MKGLVLLTGATGFVGRQILLSLLAAGVAVRVVVRKDSEDRLVSKHRLERIIPTTDLFSENQSWWLEACDGVDTVVHAAWFAEPGAYLQSEQNLDCLNGSIKLAKAAVAAGIRRFVGIGTCFEYDLESEVLSVDTPLAPASLYAASKAATFLTLSQWFSLQSVEFAWCRLFYLYGEAEDERRLVPYIRKQLAAGEPAELTSGTQVRDFLNVSDAGRMIAEFALGRQQGAFNICSGVPVTVRELAESVADDYGRKDLLNFGARPDNLMDPPCVVGVRSETT